MKPGDAGFYRGVIVTLTLRYRLDGIDTFYREVVRAVSRDNLLRVARRDGDMRSSGLSAFLREGNV